MRTSFSDDQRPAPGRGHKRLEIDFPPVEVGGKLDAGGAELDLAGDANPHAVDVRVRCWLPGSRPRRPARCGQTRKKALRPRTWAASTAPAISGRRRTDPREFSFPRDRRPTSTPHSCRTPWIPWERLSGIGESGRGLVRPCGGSQSSKGAKPVLHQRIPHHSHPGLIQFASPIPVHESVQRVRTIVRPDFVRTTIFGHRN